MTRLAGVCTGHISGLPSCQTAKRRRPAWTLHYRT